MIERLFVVLGAGASRASAPTSVPRDERALPPLVTELFGRIDTGYGDVLREYPLAKLAAAELRGLGGSVAIEEVIRTRYRDSEHVHDQRIYRAIPPYLQELLHRVSYRYTAFPQNYESLVTALLRLREVVFVSLNYDVLLDGVLEVIGGPIDDMWWYVRSSGRHWSLIKLHGSINWGRRSLIDDTDIYYDPPLDLQLDDTIVFRPGRELDRMRGIAAEPGERLPDHLYYPALSVPIGQADELVCSPNHVAFLRERLERTQPLHLLLIGYSGNDREVMSLVRESGRGIRTLTVVDRDQASAEAVIARLQADHELRADLVWAYPGDFDHFVAGGGLGRYVDDMTGLPY